MGNHLAQIVYPRVRQRFLQPLQNNEGNPSVKLQETERRLKDRGSSHVGTDFCFHFEMRLDDETSFVGGAR
jgi:hypothetical protein